MNDTGVLEPQDWTFPVPIAYGPASPAEMPALVEEAIAGAR